MEAVMAGLIVNNTEKIIRDNGPDIIREQYWEKYVPAGEKPGWRDRLQSAAGPHKSGGDPHIAGRALDIILFADKPNERRVAERIVNAFLNLREQMKWISVIYNGTEWNRFGKPMPRGGDAVNRHVTHIHIEWSSADINNTGFEDALAAELVNVPDTFE
jgi:hypothetical protein